MTILKPSGKFKHQMQTTEAEEKNDRECAKANPNNDT